MYELLKATGAELTVVATAPFIILAAAIYVRSHRDGSWWRSDGVASGLALVLTLAMSGACTLAMSALFKAKLSLLVAGLVPFAVTILAAAAGWLLLRAGRRLARADQAAAMPVYGPT